MTKQEIKKVGLIGCGAIGTLVAQAVEKKLVLCDKLILYDNIQNKAIALKNSIDFPAIVVKNLDEMLQLKPKIILEAASQKAVKDYIKPITSKGINLIVMSSGALIGSDYKTEKVHVPSGAISETLHLGVIPSDGTAEYINTSRKGYLSAYASPGMSPS